jgi:hypothetical protein
MGNLECALGEPLSLSGRVRRELQFDLEAVTRGYALGLRDEDCQVLMPANTFTPQLGRFLGVAKVPRRTNIPAIAVVGRISPAAA